MRSLKISMAKKKRKRKMDNDLHNSTEKTKDLATGIQQQKRGVK